MRKKIVAGNWKMNTTRPDGKELAAAVAARAAEVPAGVGLIIAPPFTHLCACGKAIEGSKAIGRDIIIPLLPLKRKNIIPYE